VEAGDMAHPFRVHGTSFQVLRDNGRALDFAHTGWNDVWRVSGTSELPMRFAQASDSAART
jgi:FtsP/CotA-like multicopper oxidase with cupredoxin domain